MAVTAPVVAPPSGSPTAAAAAVAAAATSQATSRASDAVAAASADGTELLVAPRTAVHTRPTVAPTTTFHVTGFGRFHGVTDNPSARLVEGLPAALARSRAAAADSPGGLPIGRPVLASNTVLTVSTAAVDAALESLYDRIARDCVAAGTATASGRVVVVHFGVDTRARCFHLEAVAVNEARFGVADEANAQPWGCAVETGDLGDNVREGEGSMAENLAAAATAGKGPPPPAQRRSQLPLRAVLRALQMQGWNVSINHDAGRFVCNWTYYRSLVHVARLAATARVPTAASAPVAGGLAAAAVGAVTTSPRGPTPAAEGDSGAGSSGSDKACGGGFPPELSSPGSAVCRTPVAALFVHLPAAQSEADHKRFANFGAALLDVLAATAWP
ncbi:hypothetical protein MMPV_003518 [Pyropia vietnamensis]